jgi:catalase
VVHSAVLFSVVYSDTQRDRVKPRYSALPFVQPATENSPTATMCDPRTNLQAFQPTQRSKRKRNAQTPSSEASTSFLSPNQSAVLSDSESDIEDDGKPTPTKRASGKDTPIVIYSYLNNHSTTLKQVNEKLSKPVM